MVEVINTIYMNVCIFENKLLTFIEMGVGCYWLVCPDYQSNY